MATLQLFLLQEISKHKEEQLQDWYIMLHLWRPLESRDLKFAYFTQMNTQKIIRVHVLRSGLLIYKQNHKFLKHRQVL